MTTTFKASPPGALTRAEYDAIDAIHWSTLKEMRRSPLHYRYREQHPLDPSPAMVLGLAVHTAVLEPMEFLRQYALYEGERRAGKKWKAFEAAHAGKTILKRGEYDTCVAMQAAVRAHPAAAPLLARGRAEQSVTWTDPETGLACRARMDWLCDVPGFACLIDLKSTATIDASLFGATAARMGHYGQIAFYTRGLRAHGLLMPARLIAVEQRPPHDVAVFDVDGDTLAAGDEEVSELLAKVKECRERGEWPGRYADPQPLRLPAWFFADAEDATGFGITIEGEAL